MALPAPAVAADGNSGTRTKLAMNPRRTLLVVMCVGLLLAALSPVGTAGQNPATNRLLELINGGDVDSVEDKLPRAAVDAGPPALPYVRSIVERSTDEDRRGLALVAALYIGGDDAISLIRQEQKRQADEDFGMALATVLASSDTPANRRELIGILSEDEHWVSTSAAALSLGILRAGEAIPALRVIPREPDRDGSELLDLSLKWIEKGYWSVANVPNTEQGRAIAAVLRNGSPNIDESDYVFDRIDGGFWTFGPSGWSFNRGRPSNRSQEGPTITAFIGAEARGRSCPSKCAAECDVEPAMTFY